MNGLLIDEMEITSFNFDADKVEAWEYEDNNPDATDSFTVVAVKYCCSQKKKENSHVFFVNVTTCHLRLFVLLAFAIKSKEKQSIHMCFVFAILFLVFLNCFNPHTN